MSYELLDVVGVHIGGHTVKAMRCIEIPENPGLAPPRAPAAPASVRRGGQVNLSPSERHKWLT